MRVPASRVCFTRPQSRLRPNKNKRVFPLTKSRAAFSRTLLSERSKIVPATGPMHVLPPTRPETGTFLRWWPQHAPSRSPEPRAILYRGREGEGAGGEILCTHTSSSSLDRDESTYFEAKHHSHINSHPHTPKHFSQFQPTKSICLNAIKALARHLVSTWRGNSFRSEGEGGLASPAGLRQSPVLNPPRR